MPMTLFWEIARVVARNLVNTLLDKGTQMLVGFEWLGVHFDIYRRSRVAILPLIQVPVVAKILQTNAKQTLLLK